MNMHPQGGVANHDQRPNAGIDVCKQHLDVCLNTLAVRVANDANGWDELTAKLKAAHVDLVALEATGGYERGLEDRLFKRPFSSPEHPPRALRHEPKWLLRAAPAR